MSDWTDYEKKSDWTDYEKKLATRIKKYRDFSNFLRWNFEEFEELANGQCDVFQLAKEVFEIESIVDEYEDFYGFLLNNINFTHKELNFGVPIVSRPGFSIQECNYYDRQKGEICTNQGNLVSLSKFYVVRGVNGVEILVHKSAVEFYKTYL